MLLDVGYDPLGRRSRKASEGADATTYLYDGIDMIARSGPEGSEFMINGLGVDEHLAALGAAGEHYFAVDGINSTVALTDGSGQATSRYAYNPYGTVQATGEDGESLLYTGRERDLADLYFYRARYYSPVSGRFVSSDPLGFGGGQLNFYAYVGSRPTMYSDPTGLCPEGGGWWPSSKKNEPTGEIDPTKGPKCPLPMPNDPLKPIPIPGDPVMGCHAAMLDKITKCTKKCPGVLDRTACIEEWRFREPACVADHAGE